MSKRRGQDPDWDIRFYESFLRRDPGYVMVLELLGGLYTQQGRIVDGLKVDRRLVRLQPDNATARYNLACSLALLKRQRDALRELQAAVQLGYRDLEWMEQDPDLDGLKDHPAFRALVKVLKPQS